MYSVVSQMSIVAMVICALAGVVIPIAMCIYIKKKYNCSLKAFFIGCGVMFIFAFTLEQMVHMIVLGSQVGVTIANNIWLYGIYGGLMAGLFEETGRFVAFKFLLNKKDSDKSQFNSLMYGAGHGGFEAFYLLTITMATYITYALQLNSQGIEQVVASVPNEAQASINAVIGALMSTHPAMYFVSIIERLAAVIAQLGLSVLVWFAVKGDKKNKWFYPLAIVLHMMLDTVAVIVNSYVKNVLIVEVLIWIMAIGIAVFACKVWKKNQIAEEAV